MRLPIPALLRPAPIRRRLWQGAVALGLMLATFLAGNFVISRDRAVTGGMLGHDFLPFYVAGTLARHGQFDRLYDLEAIKTLEVQVAADNGLEIGESFGPYWNPPFYAWTFAGLSKLPYRTARNLWIISNLLALAGAVVLLVRMLPFNARDWRTWGLVPLLILVSMPFVQALSHGQNTFTSLVILCGVVALWRARRDVPAGIVCGLLFYKPQLAAVVAVTLMLSRGWRAGLGLSFTLGILCLATGATMPDAIGDYLHRLPQNVRFMQVENEYLWERHVTFKGLWRLLIQGREAGEAVLRVQLLTWASGLVVAGGLLRAAWQHRADAADDIFTGETRFIRRDRLIAAGIVAMPLLMPFYFDYDLLLLAVPAVLFAGEVMMRAPGRPLDRGDRWLLGAWVALFAWLMINPLVARVSGINLTVLLLATVAGLMIRRASQPVEPAKYAIRLPEVLPVTARRAA